MNFPVCAQWCIFTEERKLEVPPRETLRMSDTLGYIWYTLPHQIKESRTKSLSVKR